MISARRCPSLRDLLLCIPKYSRTTFVLHGKISWEEISCGRHNHRRRRRLSGRNRARVSINVISRSPHGFGMDSLRARFISIPGEIVAARVSFLVPPHFFCIPLHCAVAPSRRLIVFSRRHHRTSRSVNLSKFQFLHHVTNLEVLSSLRVRIHSQKDKTVFVLPISIKQFFLYWMIIRNVKNNQ